MQAPVSTKESVIILSTSQDMAQLKNSSESAGFNVLPAASPSECLPLIGQNKPMMLVHNLRNFDPSQINLFHQRLARHEHAVSMKRVVLAPDLTLSVLAMVSDCGLHKAYHLALALTNLGLRILEIKKEDSNRSAVQSLVHNLRVIQNERPSAEFNKAVEDAYAAFPHDLIVKLEFGNLTFRQGNYEKAREIAMRVMQLEPHNLRAMNLLARTEMKRGEKGTALRILDAADKLCSHNPDRLNLMGDVLLQQGKFKEAKQRYMSALAVDSRSIDARESLSRCPLTEDEIEQSLKIFAEPLSESEIAAFLNNAGIHALNQDRFDDALKLYQAALSHLEDKQLKASVYYNLGLANRKNGRSIEAIVAFKECLNLHPNHSAAKENIAAMQTLADAC